MTSPNMVQIDQADLDGFADRFQAAKVALSAYINTLIAAARPLADADEAGLNQALADLDALAPPEPA